MAEKSRIKNLSTRALVFYKYGTMVLVAMIVGLMAYRTYQDWSSIIMYVSYIWIIYLWLKANSKVYHTEFDDEFLYVRYRGAEVLISLENIKDIELKTLGGVWRVDLEYADLLGDHFYFKPSLLYPLNYRKKDALVDLLWKYIERAKTKNIPLPMNALRS